MREEIDQSDINKMNNFIFNNFFSKKPSCDFVRNY
jgi:hypothetical protein